MEGEFVAEMNTPKLKNILAPRNWLTLSVPCSASSRYGEETMELSKEKGSSQRSSNVGGPCRGDVGDIFVPSKKRRMTLDLSLSLSTPSYEQEGEEHVGGDVFVPSKKRRMTLDLSLSLSTPTYEPEGAEPERRGVMVVYNKNAKQMMLGMPRREESHNNVNGDNRKKLPITGIRRGWFQMMTRMCMARPVLCLRKRATKSDASPSQHRFQLGKHDADNASQPLKDLAQAAKENVVPVIVFDREGNTYEMIFKYLASSNTYRFMGRGYTNFLSNSNLKENQIVDIWGSPTENLGPGASWLAFITSDQF